MHGSGHRAEQTNSGTGSVPALLKTHVEMLAPVLMMYSTSRLASSPALPQPWCPTTWSTLERWAKLLPKSCMNSARSAWWKYCSKNWGGQGGTLRFLSQLGKLAQRACETPAPQCSHSCGSLPAASWKARPAKCWRSPKVLHSQACRPLPPSALGAVTWAQAWLLFGSSPTSPPVMLYLFRMTDGVTPRWKAALCPWGCPGSACSLAQALLTTFLSAGNRCRPPTDAHVRRSSRCQGLVLWQDSAIAPRSPSLPAGAHLTRDRTFGCLPSPQRCSQAAQLHYPTAEPLSPLDTPALVVQ